MRRMAVKMLTRSGMTTATLTTMMMKLMMIMIIIIITIITDIYTAPFLSRAHSALQIYTTSTMHNTQTPIASNHM